MRMVRLFGCLMVLWVSGGCALRTTTGAVRYTDADDVPQAAVVVAGHADLFDVLGLSVRSKLGPELQTGALGLEAGLAPRSGDIRALGFGGYAGVHMVELERRSGVSRVGAGSPYLHAGPSLCRVNTQFDNIYNCLGIWYELEMTVRRGEENTLYQGISLNYTWRGEI